LPDAWFDGEVEVEVELGSKGDRDNENEGEEREVVERESEEYLRDIRSVKRMLVILLHEVPTASYKCPPTLIYLFSGLGRSGLISLTRRIDWRLGKTWKYVNNGFHCLFWGIVTYVC